MGTTYEQGKAIAKRIAKSDSLQSLVIPKPTYIYAEGRRVTRKDKNRLADARRQAFNERERGKADMRSMSLESIVHRGSRKVNLRYS